MGGRDDGPPFAEKPLVPQTPTADVADMALLSKRAAEAPTDPRTIADIEAALTALDAERLVARSQLAGMALREKALIEAEADDAKLDELDTERRRLERAIDRADVRERRLLGIARELRDTEAQARFVAFIERYQAALEQCVDAMWRTAEKRNVLIDLRGEASRLGLEQYLNHLPLPHAGLPMTHAAIEQFGRMAPQELAALQPPGAEALTFNVRFLKAVSLPRAPGRITAGYRLDEIAAFPAAQALELVQSGVAVWVARPATAEDAQ